MENTKQVLELTDEEITELLQGETPQQEDDVDADKIGFDVELIMAHEQCSAYDEEEYSGGVKAVSKYIGMFHALINSGMDSDLASVVMSWMREDKLNTDSINGQLELAKQESIKIKKEML